MLTIVGLRSRRSAFVPLSAAGFAIVTSSVFPPVARVTGETVPLTSIDMLETSKVTEYMVEPFGRLARAIVWEMFCSLRRSTVAADFSVTGTVCKVVFPLWVEVVVIWLVIVLLLVTIVVAEVDTCTLGSETRRLNDVYVRLSEVVPAGTIGGSVSWTIRTEGVPESTEVDWVDVVPGEPKDVAAIAIPTARTSANATPMNTVFLFTDIGCSFTFEALRLR